MPQPRLHPRCCYAEASGAGNPAPGLPHGCWEGSPTPSQGKKFKGSGELQLLPVEMSSPSSDPPGSLAPLPPGLVKLQRRTAAASQSVRGLCQQLLSLEVPRMAHLESAPSTSQAEGDSSAPTASSRMAGARSGACLPSGPQRRHRHSQTKPHSSPDIHTPTGRPHSDTLARAHGCTYW